MKFKDKTKQKIGIIGGGQLGKMMILEAKKMGFYVSILDPTKKCPAHSIADQHLVADFDDKNAIKKLAQKSDLITYEFEHIDVEVLKELEAEDYKIYPTGRSLEIIQNKYHQKNVLKQDQIAVPDFKKVSNPNDIKEAADDFGYPLMLKSCTGGYDGKGNALIDNKSEVESAFQELGSGKTPLMVERYIPFKKEISIIAARGLNGKMKVYPVGENEHQNNILYETKVPAEISEELKKEAEELAREVLKVFEGIGIFCVEMFVTEEDELLVNEIAPRPHNSGHYTIEGCVTSQYEQHVRAITGLPLGDSSLVRPSVMRNILGSGKEGKAQIIGLEPALAIEGVKVHIYQKTIARPGRKMGHLTVTADSLKLAVERALEASQLIEIKGEV
ncbi:Phosphoribosylaminoimidazole carboxylase ATPase subunit [Halanaerobium saccharolyticum subsp. saccharolyticum DSM 6643]|uniref:N5-carboxyaminoimidazole ribonucleotide synthase n=1 Tax=Halanaerobium saccharolyticum subsp. saccharolyticum DSM 6643 TaxID=1293054 RepID=M5E1H4_9FIRM|nr:5-(carboxyamino)imidazole ribonucleotide synthase [Halanaerobium saccharolyticum]CCU79745.1 Phosphoribosylaminoimidazole carboxylase ATPase subunit [Halanaerobium saccharolyticum subsp. saccharolyticum DSM 6643]